MSADKTNVHTYNTRRRARNAMDFSPVLIPSAPGVHGVVAGASKVVKALPTTRSSERIRQREERQGRVIYSSSGHLLRTNPDSLSLTHLGARTSSSARVRSSSAVIDAPKPNKQPAKSARPPQRAKSASRVGTSSSATAVRRSLTPLIGIVPSRSLSVDRQDTESEALPKVSSRVSGNRSQLIVHPSLRRAQRSPSMAEHGPTSPSTAPIMAQAAAPPSAIAGAQQWSGRRDGTGGYATECRSITRHADTGCD